MTLLVNSQVGWRAFRSYYLCESHYCTPAQAHEKGGVENDIGCAQRNFFSPIPEVDSFEELNAYLHQACLQDAQRRTRGQKELVAQLWEAEKTFFCPCLPEIFQPVPPEWSRPMAICRSIMTPTATRCPTRIATSSWFPSLPISDRVPLSR